MARIRQADDIITRYQGQGFRLSVRQLYYQFVQANLIDNTQASYKQLAQLISRARLAGFLDWDAIEDRNRWCHFRRTYSSSQEALAEAHASFCIDKWESQPNHVEVTVEKAALEGVLIPVCERLQVRFHANRGYSSSSALYDLGKRLHAKRAEGKACTVIALFDHDPSGLNMGQDLLKRLQLFSQGSLTVLRIALSRSQVDRHNLPPNPAKESDSRFEAYQREHGDHSWELDALDPGLLAKMLERAILSLRDDQLWKEAVSMEEDMREQLELEAD